MKIAQICTNAMNGAVGKIARTLSESLIAQGHESVVCYARGGEYKNEQSFRFGNKCSTYFHVLNARLFDGDGLHSKKATECLINFLDSFNPDIIHIHCLHGYYINYPLLFEYIKNKRRKVVWTMHDCWAYTGHCAFYDFVKCCKWKTGCNHCPQKKEYPKSLFLDQSARNYNLKKNIFTSVNSDDIKIVTPSVWLKECINESFLSCYPAKVIFNDVDTSIFYPDSKVDIERRILGVANVWNRRKGLEDFIELSRFIPDNYKILIIGASKEQRKMLAENGIDAIGKTADAKELAHYYRTSTILFNPTYEDNYPTVNVEAISCGLPVVTYRTGGSPEIIDRVGMGNVVKNKDYYAVIECLDKAFFRDRTSNPEIKPLMVEQYIETYKELM